DAQHLAVAERLVHAPVGVVEDPQRAQLRRHPVGDRLVVVVAHAQQDEQPGADRPGDGAVDADLGAADALDERSHRRGEPATATTRTIMVDHATAEAAIRWSRPYRWATSTELTPHGIAACSR